MAAAHRTYLVAVCVMFIVTTFVGSSWAIVHELNSDNIAKFLKGKLLTLIFVDSPSCSRCRILYPFFVAASQAFPNNPEIFFSRTHDRNLIKQWGVSELPVIMHHRVGMKTQQQLKIDVTVDGIIDEIARLLQGNFADIKRTYSININYKNYDELIVASQQYTLILVHDKDDHNEREVIEQLAYTFRNDDAIMFASLDLVTQRKLRDEIFMTKETPVVMWISHDDKKTPMRFGAVLSHELLTQFVNERTLLQRELSGDLMPEAGLIPLADEIINSYVALIMEGKTEQMQSAIYSIEKLLETSERHHAEMVEYYLYILENIVANGASTSVKDIFKKLDQILVDKEGLSVKQKDIVSRKRNIIAHFLNLQQNYNTEQEALLKEKLQLELENKGKDKKSQRKTQKIHEPITNREEL
uniref:Endoplasmic reticulum resident protein 29 C-terminal domain-containing protein n=2 Tax=Arion vulgaris TaxID=1028688 RepID=A0A0B7AXQ4_9EUPU